MSLQYFEEKMFFIKIFLSQYCAQNFVCDVGLKENLNPATNLLYCLFHINNKKISHYCITNTTAFTTATTIIREVTIITSATNTELYRLLQQLQQFLRQ